MTAAFELVQGWCFREVVEIVINYAALTNWVAVDDTGSSSTVNFSLPEIKQNSD